MMKNDILSVLSLVFFSFGVALSSQIYVVFLVPILFLIILNPKSFLPSLKRLIFLNLFIFLISLSAVLAGILQMAILIFVRSNIIVFFAILLFYKKDGYFFASGISKLVFSDKFAWSIYLSINYIGFLSSDLKRLKKTLLIRGLIPQTSLFCYKAYANMVALLFLSAYKRISAMQKTMISRGFNGKFFRKKEKFKINFGDFLVFFSVVICGFVKFGVLI